MTAAGDKKVWNPKSESAMSAAVHDHLSQEFGDQLVVNREVLAKPTTSRGHGLSVDVLTPPPKPPTDLAWRAARLR